MGEIIIGSGKATFVEPGLAYLELVNQTVSSSGQFATVDKGLYRLSIYVRTIVAGNGSVSVTVSYTDDAGATSVSVGSSLNLTAGTNGTGSVVFRSVAGPINYTVTQSGTGKHNITFILEKLA